jgi:hypothetical protein
VLGRCSVCVTEADGRWNPRLILVAGKPNPFSQAFTGSIDYYYMVERGRSIASYLYKQIHVEATDCYFIIKGVLNRML